jgi:hypothetical protein
METFQLILLILVFVSLALAMFFRKMPALVALPIMAFLIPIVCGVSINDTIQYVIGNGALRLHNAYTIVLFGSMLSALVQKTGIVESFVRVGAELAGDNPFIVALIMLVITTLLFTTLTGLGAIIMVATIVLPIMSSIGFAPISVAGIFLFGISMGGILNAANWAVYIDIMELSLNEIRPFALIMFALTFIVSISYIAIQSYKSGQELNFKKISKYLVITILAIILFILVYNNLGNKATNIRFALSGVGYAIKITIGTAIIFLYLLSMLRCVILKNTSVNKIYWSAYFTPLIPLILILVFSMDFIAAFICGLVYGFISTYKKGSLNTLVQSMFQGASIVMPAVILMFGIGMLLNAIIGPGEAWTGSWPVLNLLQPVIMKIVPEDPLLYILIFGFAAPLALYRGPLNVWGMGYGLAAILIAGGINAGAVMGLLMAVGQVQGISDPTNTHNVWIANEVKQNVQKILWNTLPYTWIIAFLGLATSAIMFL